MYYLPMKSILIIIDYFGKWPEWLLVFLANCEANPTVNWLIHKELIAKKGMFYKQWNQQQLSA